MTIITVHGTPAPQGSKRHVGNGVMIESSKKVRPWREAVKWAVLQQAPGVRYEGAVEVRIIFSLHRPKTLPKKIVHCTKKPDGDKLQRSTYDALKDAGIIRDDAQIVHADVWKVYVGHPQSMLTPGANIWIEDIA